MTCQALPFKRVQKHPVPLQDDLQSWVMVTSHLANTQRTSIDINIDVTLETHVPTLALQTFSNNQLSENLDTACTQQREETNAAENVSVVAQTDVTIGHLSKNTDDLDRYARS